MTSTYQSVGTLIDINGVSKSFGETQILKNVSGKINDIVGHGQVVSLLGPSGVGKTTLLRILAGLSRADSGTVTAFDSKTNTQIPIETGVVGVVSQHYPLFQHHTVLGNLLVANPKAKQKASEYLERFGLSDRANHYPCQLSGGGRQRIAIIQQLLCSEHYILMDEPFSGLDPLMKSEVCNLITEVANLDEKNTIILVTHDVSEAVAVSDTIWLMGRDRDEANKPIPGAYVKKVYDLASLNLAWRPDIYTLQQYSDFVRELKLEFKNL
jgi:polar amino acid transport system ATP-binding protein/sulfate transport system ATP-binding protein